MPSTQEGELKINQFRQKFQQARKDRLDKLTPRFQQELKSSIGNFEIKLQEISNLPPEAEGNDMGFAVCVCGNAKGLLTSYSLLRDRLDLLEAKQP